MAKTNAFGVQIDTCYKCGGIFLDNGEFEQIRTHFKKRQKVQQVNVNDTSKINLQDFYNYEQDNYNRLNFLLTILLTPLHRRRRNRFF